MTIDTLRADHLGAYGYPEGTSPGFDRLARKSAQFRSFLSVSSWTMPAMGTLGTGARPNRHGLIYWHMPLRDDVPTLGETLGRKGVRTAFLGNPIPRLPGLERGFDTWETFGGNDAAAVDAALAWLADTDGADRFLWVHLLSPHAPYDPLPGTARPVPGRPPEVAAYDGEIRTVDLQLGRLLRAIGPDALLLVTSDHGEIMDERDDNRFNHGKYLYEELVQVPCLVRSPEAPGALVAEAGTIADLHRTIVDAFGVKPPRDATGRPLLPGLRRGEGPGVDVQFSMAVEDEPPRHKDKRWSVRTGETKTVFVVDKDAIEHYDLTTDPEERRNLADVDPEAVERHREMLEEWLEEEPTPPIPFNRFFPPQVLEQLQAMGYLGGNPH